MSRRTLLLSNLFLTAAVLFLLGIAAAPLLGLIPPQTFTGRPAATISLDLSEQVRALQQRGAELNAALEANVGRMGDLERALANSRRESRSISEAPDPEKDILRTSIATLQQTVDSLKRQNDLLSARAEALAGSRDAVVRDDAESRARIEELEGILAAYEHDAEATRTALTAELVAMRETLDARDRDLSALRAQLDDALDEAAELRAASEAAAEAQKSEASPPPAEPPTNASVAEIDNVTPPLAEIPASVPAAGPTPTSSADSPVPAAAEGDRSVAESSVADGVAAYQLGDYDTAYRIWRPLADAGTARAQFHLGALYFEGRGVPRDLDEARQWLERAAANGSVAAPALLSRIEGARAAEAR